MPMIDVAEAAHQLWPQMPQYHSAGIGQHPPAFHHGSMFMKSDGMP